jgi:hypothetical protein
MRKELSDGREWKNNLNILERHENCLFEVVK